MTPLRCGLYFLARTGSKKSCRPNGSRRASSWCSSARRRHGLLQRFLLNENTKGVMTLFKQLHIYAYTYTHRHMHMHIYIHVCHTRVYIYIYTHDNPLFRRSKDTLGRSSKMWAGSCWPLARPRSVSACSREEE